MSSPTTLQRAPSTMIGLKEIPRRETLVDYNYAVAGHAGTLCDPDGELFIKPCTQDEIDFYQSAAEDHPEFADIMPLFMGTLLLNDATDIEDINEQLPVVADHLSQSMKEAVVELAHRGVPGKDTPWSKNGDRKIKTDRAVVLENTAYGYKKPNIMDVKLGQRLWADNAPAEKRARFDKIRMETTHEKFGFRIAGMRVYKGSENPKELDREDYRIYNKDWGRIEVTNENVVDSFRKFIFNKAAKVDKDVGRAIAQAFKVDLEHVRDMLEKEKTRMYSSSLLFVFEGDGEALRAAVEENNTSVTELEKGKGNSGRSNFRVDSGIDLDEDGELIPGIGEEDDESSEEANLPRIYGLKMIDFAHAQWLPPDEQPDENVLLGVRSLIKIFDELSK